MTAISAQLGRFFELSLDMLCIAGMDGFFKVVNPAWTQTLGWTREELLSKPYLDFVHPEDRDATISEAGGLAAGRNVITFHNRYRHRDGSYRWLQWVSTPVTDEQLIYGMARDVTALKAAEHEIYAAHLEAKRATNAKNAFLSAMSHELRTPLNAILGFAQLLEMDGGMDGDRMESVRHILKAGNHLLELINEVLDISRIESGKLSLSTEPVGVDEIVQAAVDLVKPMARQHAITITVRHADAVPIAVIADRQRLSQIMINLLSNAVKYNRPGGTVVVGVQRPSGGRCRITVTDTGFGIPPAKVDLLFEPFERLGAELTGVEGTGLGLALSRALAHAMNGSLGVDSVIDQGSTFWVELVVSERYATTVAAAGGNRNAEAAPSCGATVLYVEDNQANVRLMGGILALRPGTVLVHAPTGASALASVPERQPDVVLLDLHLPDMSGEEVLRRLRDDPSSRSIPVVVVTADAMPGLSRRLKAAGVSAHLTKPLNVKTVLEVIDGILAARQPTESAPVVRSSGGSGTAGGDYIEFLRR